MIFVRPEEAENTDPFTNFTEKGATARGRLSKPQRSSGKKGKTLKKIKEFLARKKQGIPKKQGRKIKGVRQAIAFAIISEFFPGRPKVATTLL